MALIKIALGPNLKMTNSINDAAKFGSYLLADLWEYPGDNLTVFILKINRSFPSIKDNVDILEY